ncbi:MAG: L-aspartate oxidase [Oscillospiraceae bacterium]|jgi:L-aspartate oxidase|nr:L-aspartate oxidase [Oscillospiraceae bacterium]
MRYAFKLPADGDFSQVETDVLVVGAGLAGLYTAMNIDRTKSVTILSKESIDLSSSWLAQGGIAAAIKTGDTPEFHYDDTQVAGADLCDPKATQVLVEEGPAAIEDLRKLAVPFDLNAEGDLMVTREGGHHQNRIVHAGGDATGRETVKVLSPLVMAQPNVTGAEQSMLVDILTDADGVCGAVIRSKNDDYVICKTRSIVIATGGIGQVFLISTNPYVATGDGLAAAIRAGAETKDLEFVQFHPTGLFDRTGTYGTRAFLISEAMRGEGALLKNRAGERFMANQHELAELAPRDIVARAILSEINRTGDTSVFLDVTHLTREFLESRFPTIFNECLSRGIDISKDWIPVAPVHHYMMGGIRTDIDAESTIPGLYAVGEAACTGVHGANRLASNSMLECLVFGRRAAMHINAESRERKAESINLDALPKPVSAPGSVKLDNKALDEIRHNIQLLMHANVGAVKTLDGMENTSGIITAMLMTLESGYDPSRKYLEVLNIATVALAITNASIERKESVGSHYVISNQG